jgi:hypothetical protein
MRRLLLVSALLSTIAWQAARAEEPTRAEFRGDWVPAAADCAGSPLRLRVGELDVTLVNGKDEEKLGNLAWPSSYFGPDYTGISAVAIPDGDSGNQLLTLYFNADEKAGVTKVIYEEGVERPGPQFEMYNQVFRKAKALKARFPLDGVDLKRCAGD